MSHAKDEGIQHYNADAAAFEEVEKVSDSKDDQAQEMLLFVRDEIVRLWGIAERPVFLVSPLSTFSSNSLN